MFKLNKLILYALFKFILFVSLYYIKTKKVKNNTILKNFNYIFLYFSLLNQARKIIFRIRGLNGA